MGHVPSVRWLRRAVAVSALLVTATSLPARAGMVALQAVSTVVSQPGDTGHICVMIATNGLQVAGVQANLSWDGTCATMTDPPNCYAAGSHNKAVKPDLGHQPDFTTKVLVLALDNVDPIPDGGLFCCDVEGEADPGQCCPINITGAAASDPTGNKITAVGNSAQICTANADQPAAGFTGNNQPLSGGNAPVGNETAPGAAAPAPAPAAPAGAPVNQVLQGGGARVEVPTLQAVPPTPAPPTAAAAGAAPAAGSAQRPPLPPATAAMAPAAPVPATAAAPPSAAATEAPTSPPTEPPAPALAATGAAAAPPTRGVPTARQQQVEPMAKAGNSSGWFGCEVGPSTPGPVVGLGLIALFGAMLQRRRRARRPPDSRTQR